LRQARHRHRLTVKFAGLVVEMVHGLEPASGAVPQ
jgi:hypothetical protein